MQIGCTKKLQDYLKEKISTVDVTIDPFFSWSASLVTVNRRKTIVIVNDYSRCGFVLYGVKAKQLRDLESIIWDSIRVMLESESVAPELINQYIESCGTSISYTKTKDRASVARLNRFCRRIELWADDYIPDTILQKHLMRRFNNDLFTVSGQYVKPTDMLEKGFREHYRADRVFQYQMVNLNIRLSLDIPCYRRIRIPLNSSLAELHRIIQLLFCWQGYHLHEFRTEMDMTLDILFPEYSFLARETQYGDLDYTKMESVIFLSEVFSRCSSLYYIYDMGDWWEHKIEFCSIDAGCDSDAARCILAEGTSPPEDVGGIDGYAELRRILDNPQDEEYEEMKNWVDSIGWRPLDVEDINRRLQAIR